MIAYKLVRKLKDGSLSPLFINKKQRFVINEWMNSESHKTNGFAYRPGFHCVEKPEANHLSKNGRVWIIVEVDDFKYYKRPVNQGGNWILANKMKILKEL